MKSNSLQTPDFLFNDRLHSLTNREWDVLLLLTEDISNTEIAERLYITPKSVKGYKTRIGNKLLLEGRDHLARFARKNGGLIQSKYQQLYSNF